MCCQCLRLQLTHNALQLLVFFYFFSIFCQPYPEYWCQPYPGFKALSQRERPRLLQYDFLTRDKLDSVISKNNSSVRFGLFLEKRCLWSCINAVQKLQKLSVLSLLITNYSSVYLSIYLFILSIYLLTYTPVGRSLLYQRIPCLAEGYS